MSNPRFTAESSLYRASGHYYGATALAHTQAAILQEFSWPGSLGIGPTPAFVSCDPFCHLDETGACVRDCTRCPGGVPDGCVEFTKPCPPSACCPPGQDACYVGGKSAFCCPPG